MDYDSENLSFDRPPLIPPLEKGGMWELENDWSLFYRGEIYHIPAGFKTDGASIPRFLWRVCGTPLDAPRVYAAIVHDWLYSGGDVKASRADADAIYRDLQIALGVPRFKACVEWAALRWFGGSHWYENTKMKEGSK